MNSLNSLNNINNIIKNNTACTSSPAPVSLISDISKKIMKNYK